MSFEKNLNFHEMNPNEVYLNKLSEPNNLHSCAWLGVFIIFTMECRVGFRFCEFHSLWLLNNSTTKNSTRLDVQGCFEYTQVRYC